MLEGQLQRAKASLERAGMGDATSSGHVGQEGHARWAHSQVAGGVALKVCTLVSQAVFIVWEMCNSDKQQNSSSCAYRHLNMPYPRAAHRAMARQSAAAEERAARLAEENAMLQRELSLRPTPDQYGSLQRQIGIMTRQLSALAAEKASTATAKIRCGSCG